MPWLKKQKNSPVSLWQFVGLLSILLVLFVVLFWQSIMLLADQRAEQLVALTVVGQERWMTNVAELTLSQLVTLPEVQKLDKQSCQSFESDFTHSQGLFTSIALGDVNGNPICITTAPDVNTQNLPTMSDRLYYQRVKTAKGLVVGEYVVTKITKQSVLHYAYPILDKDGNFKGFVMLAIDLTWFPQDIANQSFTGSGTQIFAVDHNGKTLFAYPAMASKVGSDAVNPALISSFLSSNQSTYRYLKGADGQYRVYAHGPIDGQAGIIVFAGVSLSTYLRIMLLPLGLILVIGYLVYWFHVQRDHKNK